MEFKYNPLDDVVWSVREVSIKNKDGYVIFQQSVEAPTLWSDRAVAIVASKYFRGAGEKRESSIRSLIMRIVDTISAQDETLRWPLYYLLVNQIMAFNTPVWLNVGFEPEPQSSACFILHVDDSMESIMEWYRTEGLIFKEGSGAGVNISNLRSHREFLSGGGQPSGPVSFMRAADTSAGIIKSGGAVRRASKMVAMDVDHPDIMEFITCKMREERKARVLAESGFDLGMDGLDAFRVAFQNSNHSVVLTDEFFRAVEDDETICMVARTTGETIFEYNARDILAVMSEAIWECGDPGVLFDGAIQANNPLPEWGRIRATNPCGELVAHDNSACNLACLNLVNLVTPCGDNFDIDWMLLDWAVDITIRAMDTLIDISGFPTPEIGDYSRKFRPLGLGFSNLGSLLMRAGIPYDSDRGREVAAKITRSITMTAAATSGKLAQERGINMTDEEAQHCADLMQSHVFGNSHHCNDRFAPVRNSQVTLVMPAGTVGFVMDCDTTGIEPETALVKTKTMVGGGVEVITSNAVRSALKSIGLRSQKDIEHVLDYVKETGGIEGAPLVSPSDYPVFACALSSPTINPMGHLRMVAAVQQHISGAISKTINLPSTVTPDEISAYVVKAHELGLKGVTFYRDGCKANQPLVAGRISETKVASKRRKLPVDCAGKRHKFEINGFEGYLHTGEYENGELGEIFITMGKEGSAIAGLMDTIATLTSIGLQYGVQLQALVDKFSHVRFDPSGFTNHDELKVVSSVVDYIFQYLGLNYSQGKVKMERKPEKVAQDLCCSCGGVMEYAGKCMVCTVCGVSNGCG